jgi:phosphoribosyl-AMP cyclohydrolase
MGQALTLMRPADQLKRLLDCHCHRPLCCRLSASLQLEKQNHSTLLRRHPTLPSMSASDSITFAPLPGGENADETLTFCPKFDANGLLAAVAIDAETKEPLMLAWMNEESLRQTLEIGEAVYFSRSRQEIWHKGATSGHTQTVREIRTDCDQDSLILYVDQKGAGACHTNRRSCFYRQVEAGNPTTLKEV